jgi:AcrR family transcriptional regulator
MKKPSATRRAGRRSGESTSRADILAAARARFAQQGYTATTIRQVAADAGVDAALVHYFFTNKEGLFAAAMELHFSPVDLVAPALEGGLEGAGERLVRGFLRLWEDREAASPLLAMVRSAATTEQSAQVLREFLVREVRPRLSALTGRPDGDLRAVLVGSALVGLVFERYILELEPLASADPETLVAWVGPTVQRYLDGEPG